MSDPRWRDTVALGVPVAVLLVLQARVSSWWWVGDDPCLLLSVVRHGGLAHFWSPEVWRPLSGTLLMPWLLGSLALDETVFGLDPRGYYVHQLLSLLALVVTLYALARTRLTPFGAGVLALLFVASSPVLALAPQIAARHYVEGTVLTLVAGALFVRAVRSRRLRWALAGAVVFALAATAKEVFVPLVALLPILPVGDLGQRLRSAIPYALAAALYAPWRFYMLGPANVLGGYLPSGRAASPARLGDWLAGAGLVAPWQRIVLLILLAAALVVLARRSSRPASVGLAALAVMAVLAGPLLPVVEQLAPRHLLLPWLAASTLIGFGLEEARLRWRRAGAWVSLAVVAFGLVTLSRSATWQGGSRTASLFRAEGAHVLHGSEGGVLVASSPHSHFLGCLARLRAETLGTPGGPAFCVEACPCSVLRPGQPRVRYAGGRLETFEPPVSRCGEGHPLEVELRNDRDRGRVAWSLGPHAAEEGAYSVLMAFGPEGSSGPPLPIPPRGDITLTVAEPLQLIFGFRSSAGWQAYSPVLTLEPGAEGLSWSRPAPRDVVLVTIDTLRADHVGAYGGDSSRTPVLDAIAAKGIVFESAASPMPETRPAHFTLFTSLYPREHGVVSNSAFPRPGLVTLPALFAAAGHRTAAFVGCRLFGDRARQTLGFGTLDAPETPQRSADLVVPRAVSWLEGLEPDQRFFLWVHLFDPHMPYQPPEGFDPDPSSPLAGSWPRFTWPSLRRAAEARGGDLPGPLLERARALYRGEVAHADYWVGRLAKALEERGRWQDALVVVAADHGECFSNGVFFDHSQCLEPGAVNVPLILRRPGGVDGGRRISAQVDLRDVGPTLLRLSGLGVPDAFRGAGLLARAASPSGEEFSFFERPHYRTIDVESRNQVLSRLRAVGGVPTRKIDPNRRSLGARSGEWLYRLDGSTEVLSRSEDHDTDRSQEEPERLERFRRALEEWENELRPPILEDDLDPEQVENLRSLGYF